MSPAGYVIRSAEPSDAAALVELGRDVGSEPGRWLITSDEWRSASDERRYLRALRRYDHAAVFVAEAEDGAIVGRLSLARDQHPASAHVADLGLMVAASHRRLGIGTSLLEAAVHWARERAVTKLELHVFPHNPAAIALYERFGFESAGVRPGYYHDNKEDAVIMWRTVAEAQPAA